MSTDRLGTTYAPDLGTRGAQLPVGLTVAMAANQDPVQHDVIALNASGYGIVADATSVGLRVAGIYEDSRSNVSTIDGQNVVRVSNGYGGRYPMSTVAPFTTNDRIAPAYLTARRTIGKNPSASGVALPLVGVVIGLDNDGTPITWIGDTAQAFARAHLLVKAFPLAIHNIADAAASTAVAERVVSFRPKIKGTVTDVTYTGSALVIGDTDYVTVSIAKRDGAGGGAVVLATYDSRAAGNGAATAFVPKALTISVVAGALSLIDTDVVTITTVKGGAGQVLTGEFLVNGKAI